MIKWVKPSGQLIETNDLPKTIEAAQALGWKLAEDKQESPKKRGRKPKNGDSSEGN